MMKWLLGLVVVGLVGGGGYVAHDYYVAGLHTRPNMPPGSFSLSYKAGLRAVMIDVPDDRSSRRYLGYPFDVAPYLQEAWSLCHPPTQEEAEFVTAFMAKKNLPGGRFEGLCKIKADDDTVYRGVVVSVPKL